MEYRVTQLLIGLTFVLLLIGGTVNPTGSSLACPEPTLVCHGELFPKLVGGVLYEHGHRLFAMLVGFVQIALTVLLWRRGGTLRKLGLLALGAVVFQGTLGAITVHQKLLWWVSTAHLFLALSYMALLLYIGRRLRPSALRVPAAVKTWAAVASLALLAQILLGGLVRHHEASLASLELWPLVTGELFAAGAPFALKLHFAHRLGGVLVGLIVILSGVAIFRLSKGAPGIRGRALALPVLVCTQVCLGLFVVASLRSVPVAVAHFGVAALLWVTACSLFLRSRETA